MISTNLGLWKQGEIIMDIEKTNLLYTNLVSKLEESNRLLLASAQFQQNTMQRLIELKDLNIQFQTHQIQQQHSNPLNKFGMKCFSQTDEDGITIEIVRRIGISKGVFLEFGVGDGLENNTLILASMDWTGSWVGGEDLIFDYSNASNFSYIKDWITLDNINTHAKQSLINICKDVIDVDVMSLDFDGNDIYFVESLLKYGFKPKLFIVEYNAKFPFPAKFQIEYNPYHKFDHNDYFGAALTNFVEMFEKFQYTLICCNSHTGANAFFVDKDFIHLFNDVPKDIMKLYAPPRYHLYSSYGHRPSIKVVENILNRKK